MNVHKSPGAVLAATAGAIFAIDQATKAIVRHELTPCSAPPVSLCDRVSIVGPLGLLRTDNGDGAFGLLAGEAIGPVLIALLGVLLWRTAGLRLTPLLAVAIGLQLGGLVANLADRALFGVVTDFIDLRVGLADKGVVLNPADVGLAVGGVLFAMVLSRGAQPRPMRPLEPNGEVGSA
jgi:lipoprotein signal peptidase